MAYCPECGGTYNGYELCSDCAGRYETEDCGITPEQYHAGLDKLWAALRETEPQNQDIFTLVAEHVEIQRKLLNEVKGVLEETYRYLEEYDDPDTGHYERGLLEFVNKVLKKIRNESSY